MEYFKKLQDLFSKIEVKDSQAKTLILSSAISRIVKLIIDQARQGSKVMLIGNGGSASIASHIATDFLKNAKVPSIAFNDSSLITCLSNDLGYENVFAKPLEMLAKKGDILFSISSSGKSKNIINATEEARDQGCFIITLSGFEKDNPLRTLGDINFYVPSCVYAYAEIVHLGICHLIADSIGENNG